MLTRRRTPAAVLAAAALILFTAACADDDAVTTTRLQAPTTTEGEATTTTEKPVGAGMTVADALAEPGGTPVKVDGFLVAAEGGDVLLAEVLAESYPPQAGGAVLVVEGLDPASVPGAITDMGVTWTDGAIQLEGTVTGGVLTVG
jgi:hypothetical protein